MQRQGLAFLLPLLLLALPARGDIAAPAWQTLVFEKRHLLGIARAEVAIQTGGACTDAGWRLVVDNSLPGTRETVDLTLACDSGAILERERFSQGTDQRLLAWSYSEAVVLRDRREPTDAGEGADVPSEQWPLSSRLRVEVPPEAQGETITSPYGLLALFDTLIDEPAGNRLLVHTDRHFYRLAVSGEREDLGLGDPVPWGDGVLQGNRSVHRLTLRAVPLDAAAGDKDFTLFGLSGAIVIDVDAETRLPLRIRGSAPRIGTTTLRLVGAVPREQ